MHKFLVRFAHPMKLVACRLHLLPVNAEELNLAVLDLPYPPGGLSEPDSLYSFAGLGPDTNQCETGVGVYRGVAITIQELGLLVSSHRWVNSILFRSDLPFVDKGTVSSLLCLAHRLEYEKQFVPQMTDSQKRERVKLDECPLVSMTDDILPLLAPSAKASDTDAVPEPEDKLPAQNPKCQQCQRLSSKLKQLCWCCRHYSCPPFYHEPNVVDIPQLSRTVERS